MAILNLKIHLLCRLRCILHDSGNEGRFQERAPVNIISGFVSGGFCSGGEL